ncbi:MAG TPA: class I SAM-dependent methyltransferase [Flavobacteriales bacterium]|nr:class I SAM-dependent methyltransferase [Flavobacteriales bacterium]
METVDKCPVCGDLRSSDFLCPTDHTVSHEHFPIRECIACGFCFTSPRPAQGQIGNYYLSPDYISHAAKATGFRDHIYHLVRHLTIRAKHRLIKRTHPAGTVLDIGCGTGDFLAHLRAKGYATRGVEVSPQARAIAHRKHLDGVPVLEDIPPAGPFDVVTLWHVLEHVPNPKETLAKVHDLANDGALLVIAVPDRSSWDAQHYGPDWAAWDVPRHFSHFRRQDVQRLLSDSGFALRSFRKMWYDAPYVAMLSEQYRGAGPMGSLVKGALVGLASNAVSLFTDRPTSSSLYLAEKRKSP